MEPKELLSKVEVCQGLNERELAQVELLCRLQTFKADDKLFSEGTLASDLYLLGLGKVDLRFELPGRPTSKQATISSIAPGGAFGWSALVAPHRYKLSAYCTQGPARVLCLDRQSLWNLFEQQPRIGYVFMKNLSLVIGRRFHELQDDLARVEGFELMGGRRL